MNTNHSVFIAEDNPADRDALLTQISRHAELLVAGSAANGAEALSALRAHHYDLIFLDIDLPVLSGFDVLKACGTRNRAYVIITSSFPRFAVEAFDYMALDFLLKPYTRRRFDTAVQRYLDCQEKNFPEPVEDSHPVTTVDGGGRCVLKIQGKGYEWLIPHIDILYLSAHGRRTDIHCRNGDKVANLGLTELLALLPEAGFCRIHRQYAVNRRHIAGQRGDFTGQQTLFIRDADETELPIGRAYQGKLRAKER
jgi:DNA-binding LytR/AlgR family response regulator